MALFVVGFIVALLDSMIPVFIGRVVTLVTASAPERLFADHGWLLVGMGAVLLIVRPLAPHSAEPVGQPGDLRQRGEPRALAEPLAQ